MYRAQRLAEYALYDSDPTLVDSELEQYLRLLQVSGRARPYPWSIRGFSVTEIQGLVSAGTDHPWSLHHDFAGKPDSRWEIRGIAPAVRSTP